MMNPNRKTVRPVSNFLPLLILVAFGFTAEPAHGATQADAATWAAQVSSEYRVTPDLTYLTADNHAVNLDLYVPRGAGGPTPILMYFHGGGWVGNSKEANVLRFLPYLEMGWAVVNVEYRLARVSLAPAAVEDGRCALRWVIRNADRYNLDPSRIVVTGHSSGGHLSLTTAMIPAAAGLDRRCPGDEPLDVAAVINWYGFPDVGALLDGPHSINFAIQWLGNSPDRMEVAQRVSPLTYVRPGLPPILTIHGDADPNAPYQHAVELHEGLTRAGVPNQLFTVPGGGHGGFTSEETREIFATIHQFLRENGVVTDSP